MQLVAVLVLDVDRPQLDVGWLGQTLGLVLGLSLRGGKARRCRYWGEPRKPSCPPSRLRIPDRHSEDLFVGVRVEGF
jgi:hypothetical protein